MHQVGDLFELNVKLRCQKVKIYRTTTFLCLILVCSLVSHTDGVTEGGVGGFQNRLLKKTFWSRTGETNGDRRRLHNVGLGLGRQMGTGEDCIMWIFMSCTLHHV